MTPRLTDAELGWLEDECPYQSGFIADQIRSLIAEVRELRRERARIVEWLRSHTYCGLAQSYADGIDRGEHEENGR